MKAPIATATIATFLVFQAQASLIELDTTTYNFSDPESAAKMATWHDPSLVVTKQGLAGKPGGNTGRGMRLLLQPIGIGHAWRPAGSVSFTVQLNFENEAKMSPYLRYKTFARWSPNGEDWSTWQALTAPRPKADKAKKENGQTRSRFKFSGHVLVPDRETDTYHRKQREFQKLDVPWVSDEHALCEWIVKGDPKFFEKNLPFPGFIQVYVEGSVYDDNRLQSVVVDHTSTTSSLRKKRAKDPAPERKRDGVWKFWTVKKTDRKPTSGFHSPVK